MNTKLDTRTRAQRLEEMLRHDIGASFRNEQLTRKRVELLEGRALALETWRTRGFWGRLRWLLRGR